MSFQTFNPYLFRGYGDGHVFVGVTQGVAAAYTIPVTQRPDTFELTDDTIVSFFNHVGNAALATLNILPFGAKRITDAYGNALPAGVLRANRLNVAVYNQVLDGGNGAFVIVNPPELITRLFDDNPANLQLRTPGAGFINVPGVSITVPDVLPLDIIEIKGIARVSVETNNTVGYVDVAANGSRQGLAAAFNNSGGITNGLPNAVTVVKTFTGLSGSVTATMQFDNDPTSGGNFYTGAQYLETIHHKVR